MRTDMFQQVLEELKGSSADVEASALISTDGLMIASALPQHIEEMRVAGMSSTLLSLGTRAAIELGRGDLQQVLIRGDNGYGVMVRAGEGTMLLVLASKEAKLGLIFLDMSRAVQEIKKVL